MASAKSIGRLYAPVKMDNLSNSIKPDRAPVKCSNFPHLEMDVPAEPSMHDLFARSLAQPLHRRFLSPRRSRNDSPALMGTIVPANVPGDRADFAALAAQDRFRALLAKHPRRGAADAQPWAAIQL
jgi:hypothetical protein